MTGVRWRGGYAVAPAPSDSFTIESFAADDSQLDFDDTIAGANGSKLFRGMIAFDTGGAPAPVIARAHLVNGNEWPSRDVDEGVTLDYFVFERPDAP